MKENKISRRSFLKFGAAASAAGMMAAAPVAASAAQPDAAAAEVPTFYSAPYSRILSRNSANVARQSP